MKLRRILLTVLVAVSAVAVAPPPSAYAGGPTSVLMVNPSREQARAAYVSDPVYGELTAALGQGTTGPTEAPAGVQGEEVRLTWLIHDVQIWRIDRVYLSTSAGVWVETVTNLGGDSGRFDQSGVWHRPADAKALTAALTRAGLLGGASATTPRTDLTPAAVPAPAPTAAAVTQAGVPPATLLAAVGLGGIVVGAAAGLGAVRWRRRTPVEAPRVTLRG